MAFIAVAIGGSAVLGAGVSLYGMSENRKAANKAADAIAKNQINIPQLMEDARKNAAENLASSISLERTYQPGTAALRLLADEGLTNLATGNISSLNLRDSLLSQIGSTNPLLQASADSILSQLRLGGKLDAETQAQVTKTALEKGGTAGISGSGANRGLVARDLGLTSLQLLQSRQQAGLSAGSLLSQDLASRAGLAMNAYGQDSNTALNIASLIDRRALPDSGINSGSLVDLVVGQNNSQNQAYATRAGIQAQNTNGVTSILSNLIGTAGGLTAAGLAGAFSPVSTPLTNAAGAGSSLVICWVAREVYGRHNPSWLLFRRWLLEDAPRWFRNLYIRHGEWFAEFISDKPRLKEVLRRWMDTRINAKFALAGAAV